MYMFGLPVTVCPGSPRCIFTGTELYLTSPQDLLGIPRRQEALSGDQMAWSASAFVLLVAALLQGSHAWHATAMAGISSRAALQYSGNTVAMVESSSTLTETLKAEVASLAEAKAQAEAQLKEKTEQVERFVEAVESELNEARNDVKKARADVLKLMKELSALKADLEERTTEANTLNLHLEAHIGASVRLREENEQLKKVLATLEAQVVR